MSKTEPSVSLRPRPNPNPRLRSSFPTPDSLCIMTEYDPD